MLLAHRRSHRDTFPQTVADLDGFGPVDQFLRERVGDAFFDDDAAGGRAGLAGQTETGDGDQPRGQVQVRVREHEGRVFAAHFHLRAGHALSQLPVNLTADGIRARERKSSDHRVAGQFTADRPALTDDDV